MVFLGTSEFHGEFYETEFYNSIQDSVFTSCLKVLRKMPECPKHSIFNSYVVWASRTLFQEKCGYETILFKTLLN